MMSESDVRRLRAQLEAMADRASNRCEPEIAIAYRAQVVALTVVLGEHVAVAVEQQEGK